MMKVGGTRALATGVAVYCLSGCAPQTGTGYTIDSINATGAGGAGASGNAMGTVGGAGGTASTVVAGNGASTGALPPGNLGMPTDRPKDMGSGPDGSCGALPFTAQQVTNTQTITHVTPEPIDLYLMWDQSGSMKCPTSSGAGGAGGAGNQDRWDAVKAPLSAWVQSVPTDPPFNVGIGYFGVPQTNFFMPNPNECNASTYEMPDVEIGPLPQNAMAIQNSLNAHMPSTGTPTNAALQGAANHALAWKMSHPNDVVAVVLVTDGVPNACGTVQDVANTASMTWNNGAGVRTFVIGVTSPGVSCPVDPNPPNAQDLDSIAAAGGTTKALIVDVTQDSAKQLTDELNMIRQSITMTTTKTEVTTSKLACEYTLPQMAMDPHAKVVFDKDKVNVDFTSNHGMKSSAYRVDSLDKCSSTNALAWYYDSNDMPTKILICPNACAQIQAPTADGGIDPTIAGTAPTVSIVLGCKSIYAPPA
jgi:hypothetical protein